MITSLRYNRKVMHDYRDTKPIEVTELAWPASKGKKRIPKVLRVSFATTEKVQRQRLAASVKLLAQYRKAYRISGVYWFTWASDYKGRSPFDYSGLRMISAGEPLQVQEDADDVQDRGVPPRRPALSELYEPDNLLDRRTPPVRLTTFYRHAEAREAALLARHLGLPGGDVLSVGAGWHPGRHLFPAPAWRLVAVDLDPARPAMAVEAGEADDGFEGAAGRLDALPDASFDVVLYRLVLHHIAFQGPLGPCFAEARRLLRPGGALVAIEPGRGIRSARRSRRPTRAGSGSRSTGRPTTCRSRRGSCARRRRPPA